MTADMSVIDLGSTTQKVSDRANTNDRASTALARFKVVCVATVAAASVPYLWVLWDLWSGTINPLRVNGSDNLPVYDVQARAIMHGHLWITPGSIHNEAFVHDGHQYTYFGIFPSLLRIPFFLFTHSLDGRFTALSMCGAWIVTALFGCLLLWRLRMLLRGPTYLGWPEALSYGALLASILVGSVLVFLASVTDVYNEDITWSIALACASLFALVGVVERPSWGRITTCSFLVLLTNLNRTTTGLAAVVAMLAIAAWFAFGQVRTSRRRWALPLALVSLVPLAIGCAINLMKFDLLFGVPYSDQLLFRYWGFSHVNGGKYIDPRYLPSTLQSYVDPTHFRLSSLFPYAVLSDVPTTHTRGLFYTEPTASAPVAMPLLFLTGLWGVITAFRPHASLGLRGTRILLATSAATAGVVMVFGWIFERFVGDFMPLLVLASMIGTIDLWRRLGGRARATKTWALAAIGVLALWGFLANVGMAITPAEYWTRAQLSNYVEVQQKVSDISGHPLNGRVLVGKGGPPEPVPMGTLFIEGRCKELFIAYRTVKSFNIYSPWLLVERAPDNPICHSLIGSATNVDPVTRIVAPSKGETVSGSHLLIRATVLGEPPVSSVSFLVVGASKSTLLRPATHGRSGWTYAWDTRSVPNGNYSLRSVAYTTDGYVGASGAVTITVDNPVP